MFVAYASTSRAGRLLAAVALLAGLLGNLGVAQVAQAASLTVTTTADELNADGDCALREAVRAANLDTAVDACPAGAGVDTITLPAGIYVLSMSNPYDDQALSGDLDLVGALTINGAGATTTIIDGDALDRVLDVHAGANVTMSGVTLRNGVLSFSSGDRSQMGGGIYNAGTLTLNSSAVTGNALSNPLADDDEYRLFGGGIYNEGTLTLNSSTIRDNRTNPKASYSYGGGLYNASQLTVTNSTIAENFATVGGGLDNRGQATITGSVIDRNSARYSGNGGGVANEFGGSLSLTNSVVSNNAAVPLGFAEASGGSDAGIGNYDGATMTILRSSIINNVASGGGGGSARNGGIGNSGTLTVTESTISGNSAGGASFSFDCGPGATGGGIGNGGTLTLINTTVSGNSAGGSRCSDPGGSGGGGGGIANTGTLTLLSSTIADNTASQGQQANGTIWPASGGGGLHNILGTLNLRNTIVAGNTAQAATMPDCSGTLTSQGYNLIGSAAGCTIGGDTTGNKLNVAALLGPLRDNGGPTLTHALLPGSPAIDAGNPAAPGSGGNACPAADQRGVARPQDGNSDGTARCDIGAVERQDTILINGSFELDSNGDGTPDGWSANSHVTRSNAAALRGSYALRHQASDNSSYTIFSDPAVPVVAGHTYVFSGAVNIPATSDSFSLQLQVRWRDAGGQVLSTVPVVTYSAATSGWSSTTATLVAPAGAAYATIRQAVTSLNATLYVDDLRLRLVDDLLLNGSFELDSNGDGTPDGWSANSHVTRSNAAALRGSYALRHQASDDSSYTIFSDPAVAVVAGQSYRFSGWVNIPATSDSFSLQLQVRWRDAGGQVLSTVPVATYSAATSGWSSTTATLVAPAGAAYATIRQAVTSLNATLYVDDLVFGP